jgi:hypothetical protein
MGHLQVFHLAPHSKQNSVPQRQAAKTVSHSLAAGPGLRRLTNLVTARMEVDHVATLRASLPGFFFPKLDGVYHFLVLSWTPCSWMILLFATRTRVVATGTASCIIPLNLLGLDEGGAGRAMTVDSISGIHFGFPVVILPDEFGFEVRLYLAYVEGAGCWAAPDWKTCFIAQGAFESHSQTAWAVIVAGIGLGAAARSEKLACVESVCADHAVSFGRLGSRCPSLVWL